mgnify:CR=1 FL=1|jgi:hypothetical protein
MAGIESAFKNNLVSKKDAARTSIPSAMNFNKQALNDKSSTSLNMKVATEDQ